MRTRPSTAGALAAVLAAGPLAAQRTGVVYGTVRDTTGAPLAHAVVQASGTLLRTTADEAGRYRLAGIRDGPALLEVRLIGYRLERRTVQITTGDSVVADFALHPGPLYVGHEVVTAAKRSQLLDEAVTSVALVTRDDLRRRVVERIDEAVDKAPGVHYLNGQINLRGSTGYAQGLGARVLLLVDGVPMNQGDRGGINWDLVPVDWAERVEIVKGAGSALYGSGALGGVVNIITTDPPQRVHVRARATAGAFADPPHDVWAFRERMGGHGSLDVTASYRSDEFGGAATGGFRHSDGYREQSARDHWHVAAKGHYALAPATRLDLSGSWAVDEYEVPLLWCVRGTCEDGGQAYQPFKVDSSARGDRTWSGKGYVAAVLSRAATEQLSWTLRASWLRTRFTDFHRAGDDFSIANRLGVEGRVEARRTADGVVTVGAEATLADVSSDIFGTHTQGEYAVYAESERLLGRVRLTTGARIDFLAIDGSGLTAVVSPRVGAVIGAGAAVWRASAGRGFRAPSLGERFVTTVVPPFRVLPNPSLHAETAWSFELGHRRSLGVLGDLDAAAFWTEAVDYIEPAVNATTFEIQFRNLTRARLAGLDLAVTAAPFTPNLTTGLAYTLLYTREAPRDTAPARALPFRPRHLLRLSADWTPAPFTVGADLRIVSRFERVLLYESDPRVAERVLDLRFGWHWGSLDARLLVTNALNYIYNQVPRTLAPVRTLSLSAVWTY